MKSRDLGVVADLDLRIRKLAQFLDGFHIRRTHVGRGNDSQLAAVSRKGGQLVHDQSQTTPFNEGYQHIDPITGYNFLFELRIHLRFMRGAGEQAGLRDGGLRTDYLSFFIDRPNAILALKKSKQLLCTLSDRERVEVSVLCFRHDGGHNAVGKRNLRIQVATVVLQVF